MPVCWGSEAPGCHPQACSVGRSRGQGNWHSQNPPPCQAVPHTPFTQGPSVRDQLLHAPACREVTSALQPHPVSPPLHFPGADWPELILSVVSDPCALWGLSITRLHLLSRIRDTWMMGVREVRQGGEGSSCPRMRGRPGDPKPEKTVSPGVPHHTLLAGVGKMAAELRTVGQKGLCRGKIDPGSSGRRTLFSSVFTQ